MSFHYTKRNYSKYYLIIFCFVGVLLNICINLFISKIGVPIYLDTIGTIFVAFLGGVLPAIIVCLLSSMVFNIVVPGYLYFSLINVIIAFLANWFYRYSKHSKFLRTLYFILTTSIVCSSMGAVILAYVSSAPIGIAVKDISQLLNLEDAKSYTFALMVILFFLNIVDKGISLLVALLLYKIIPEGTRKDVSNYGWKQKPLSLAEIKEARNMNSRKAIHKNVAFILSTTILLLSLILIWISITFYYEDCKEEYTDEAFKVAESAATIVDGDEIYEYVKWGEKASGYNTLENELKMLLNNTQGVVKLSIFIPEQNGVLYLFQEAKEGAPIYDNGIVLPYMEEFSEYNDAFINREVVDEIMFSKDRSILTASYPIRNSSGEIVSYAVADVYMSFLWDYVREYLIKIFLCFSGFVVMILVFGFNQAGYELVLPINAITKAAGEFLDSHGDQKALDENVRKTRSIGINTGDEVEQLYKTICKMESEMAEYVRDLKHFSDTTRKTQLGLIITLAGIVESRDSRSNAHVKNTATYVGIILNGLKQKGYYPEKLSDKYIEELEMSAPLHDIGKIHIPDAILNKRDELTEEEEEIYRSHVTYGRNIMEKAIATVNDDSYLKEARNMAAYHHERWDGKGYPEGLHGEVIPLSARVLGLANALDDLTAPKGFKIPYTLDEAVEIIKSESGKKFDPKCVDALLGSINELRVAVKNNGFSRY